MPFKIFISTSNDAECREYLAAAQRALFSINEVAVSILGAEEIPVGRKRDEMAMQMIQQADIFMGIYDTHYGDVELGETVSYLEAEYQYALEANKPMLLFVQEEAKAKSAARQAVFLDFIAKQHVLVYFSDSEDLAAKVKLGIARYRLIKEESRKLKPDALNFRPEISKLDTQDPAAWGILIENILAVAEDDIEKIVRRALELHSAQEQITQDKTIENMDGRIVVKPIWGEPLRRSQFQSDIFMIMPFREQYNAIYNNTIQPLAAELNLSIKRGDDFASTESSIIQEVWAAINACRIVVAETSETNANVYYELGIAHTLGKPVILITQSKNLQDIPFDIRHLRFVTYEDTAGGHAELRDRLRHSLIWLLNDLAEGGTKAASK